jgi:sulfide dehydrogenase cytochrome subunit
VSGSTAQPLALVPAAAAAPAPAPAASSLAALPAPGGEALAHTCAACHGTEGRLGDEAFMPLAGMPRGLFTRTMQAFRSGHRPSTLMGHVAQGFTDADIAAMAAYFESVPNPESPR